MADEMLRELAPLLAEEGIDLSDDHVPDLKTLQAALGRAVERRNFELFGPVGATRQSPSTSCAWSWTRSCPATAGTAGQLLEQVQPESPDNTAATVSSCIGIALGLLDDTESATDGRGHCISFDRR